MTLVNPAYTHNKYTATPRVGAGGAFVGLGCPQQGIVYDTEIMGPCHS